MPPRQHNPLHPSLLPVLGVLLAGSLHLPCRADSTSSFSASDSASASVGSLSDSVQGSSNSSSKTTHLVAGDYRIEDMQVVQNPDPSHAAQMRLRLVAVKAQGSQDGHESPTDGALWLTLPQTTAAQAGLALGQTVQAQARPYGLVLANPKPFYVLLDDRSLDDLHTRLVTL
jgi:hypothetical protein